MFVYFVTEQNIKLIYIPDVLYWAKPKDSEHVINQMQNSFHI